MPFAWTSSRRRTLSLVFAALSFLGSRVEVSLPDLHDGHNNASGSLNQAPVAGTPGAAQDDRPSGKQETPDAPVHGGVHVDHCAHGHVATAPLVATPSKEVHQNELPMGGTLRLVGFDRPPQIRPPIL